MKKFILIILLAMIFVSIITSTSAVYNKSLNFDSGNFTVKPIVNCSVIVNTNFNIKKADIYGNVACVNGPVVVSPRGIVHGSLLLNPNVSINTSGGIEGGVIRENISFPTKGYNYSEVPTTLINRGNSTASAQPTISQSGKYGTYNVNTLLTINTANGDIFLVISSLTASSNIVIVGNGKATIIVEQSLVISGVPTFNTTKAPNRFDFVVKKPVTLTLQVASILRGNFYFEGTTLTLQNRYKIVGTVTAPLATVYLKSTGEIQGGVVCKSLDMDSAYITAAIP